MIKELILAITLGALLGFGLTGGYIAIKNSKTTGNTTQSIPTPTPGNLADGPTLEQSTPTPIDDNNSTDSHQIVIESPENESVVTNSQITLKGSTSPQSQLIIITPVKTYFALSDNAGNFSIDVEIESGVNPIQFESIDSQDNQASTQLIVTYSTAKF
jgi:hypothetical protein